MGVTEPITVHSGTAARVQIPVKLPKVMFPPDVLQSLGWSCLSWRLQVGRVVPGKGCGFRFGGGGTGIARGIVEEDANERMPAFLG